MVDRYFISSTCCHSLEVCSLLCSIKLSNICLHSRVSSKSNFIRWKYLTLMCSKIIFNGNYPNSPRVAVIAGEDLTRMIALTMAYCTYFKEDSDYLVLGAYCLHTQTAAPCVIGGKIICLHIVFPKLTQFTFPWDESIGLLHK